jgi:hypothetical protein
MTMDSKSLEKMEKIEKFLDSIVEDHEDKERLHFDELMVMDMHSYAAALAHWEGDGFNPRSFMSTDSALLLKYRDRLQEKFGMPIMTEEEGREYERMAGTPMYHKDVSNFKN